MTANLPHDQDRKGPVPTQNKQGHGKFLRVGPQKADKGEGGTVGWQEMTGKKQAVTGPSEGMWRS